MKAAYTCHRKPSLFWKCIVEKSIPDLTNSQTRHYLKISQHALEREGNEAANAQLCCEDTLALIVDKSSLPPADFCVNFASKLSQYL